MRFMPMFLASSLLFLASCNLPPVNHNGGSHQSNQKNPATSSTADNDGFEEAMITAQIAKCGLGPLHIIGDSSIRCNSRGARLLIRRTGEQVLIKFASGDMDNPKVILPKKGPNSSQTFTAPTVLRVPVQVALEVYNEGGNVEIAGMKAGIVVHNSGDEVKIRDIQGAVKLVSTGRAGEVKEVRGQVNITDAAGDLRVNGISGAVFVQDKVGKLSIHTVTGNVTARNNPGSPKIQNIEGDVTLVGMSSKKVHVEGVTGKTIWK